MKKDNLKSIPQKLWSHGGFRRDVRRLLKVPEARIAGAALAAAAVVIAVLTYGRINFFETVLVVLAGIVCGYIATRPLKGAAFGLVFGCLVFIVGLLGPIPSLAWALPVTLWILALGSLVMYGLRFRTVARVVFFTDLLKSHAGDSRDITEIYEKRPSSGVGRSPLPLVWNARKAALKPEAQAGIVAAGKQVFGVPVKLTSLRANLTLIEEGEEQKKEEKDPFIERMEEVLTSTIGPGVKVVEADYDKAEGDGEEELVSMTFSWPSSLVPRMAGEGRRRLVIQALSSALEESVRVTWRTKFNKGIVVPVPKLPTEKVPHPPRTESTPATFLRFGVGEGRSVVGWDIETDNPHCLVVGVTGGGKTSFLRTLITELPANTKISLGDLKRYESFGFEELPTIKTVARTVEQVTAMIDAAHEEMMTRLEIAETRPSARYEMPYEVIIIDELALTFELLDDYWKTEGKKAAKDRGETPSNEHPAKAKIKNLLAVGRGAQFRVMLLTQQGDAALLPTVARGNCGTRIALGNIGPESSGMVFDDRKIATAGLENITGRAWIRQGQGRPVEQMQVYWTPPFDPEDPECGPEGVEILRGLNVDVGDLSPTESAAGADEQAIPLAAKLPQGEGVDEPEAGHADDDITGVHKTTRSVDPFPIFGNVGAEGDNPPSSNALPQETQRDSEVTTEQRPSATEQASSYPDSSSPDRDTTPTSPLDVDEGTAILVEHPDTQESIDAVVETVSIDPDDPSLIALEWATYDGDAGVYVVDENDTVLVINSEA